MNISDNKCEICNKEAKIAMNDTSSKFHFSCVVHINELWDTLR